MTVRGISSIQKILSIFIILTIAATPLILSLSTTSSADYVETQNSELKKWTLMFYDDADFDRGVDVFNCHYFGKNYLKGFSDEAFSSENLNVLALQDNYTSNRSTIWYIGENHEKNPLEVYGEINMGNYTTLRDFIMYSKTNYPAERYILLVYNHGGAWKGCCWDYNYPEQTDSFPDFLTMDEMRQALVEADGVDCICFTAPCLMASLEAAYEIRDCTDIYIGSEEGSMYLYWYNSIEDLCELLNNDPDIPVIALGKEIISLVENNFKSSLWHISKIFYKIRIIPRIKYVLNVRGVFTMSAIRTDELQNVSISIDKFADNLTDILSKNHFKIKLAKSLTESFGHGLVCDIYDFADKCSMLFKSSNNSIYNSAEAVKHNISETVIANTHGFSRPRANGVNIFFPSKLIKSIGGYAGYLQADLDFLRDTSWDEFLEAYFS